MQLAFSKPISERYQLPYAEANEPNGTVHGEIDKKTGIFKTSKGAPNNNKIVKRGPVIDETYESDPFLSSARNTED